jgi:hypothetical protein
MTKVPGEVEPSKPITSAEREAQLARPKPSAVGRARFEGEREIVAHWR